MVDLAMENKESTCEREKRGPRAGGNALKLAIGSGLNLSY